MRDENGNEGTGIYYTYNELNQLTARGQSSPGDPSLVTNIKGDVSDVDHLGAAAQVDSVAVNGVAAQVYPNVGRFRAEGVTLQPGPNIITATARDLAGNTATATITTTLLSGEPITYEYDRNGCLTKKTVPEVGETIYEYDFENRLTKVTLPGGATNEFAYDGDKRRISKTNAAGEVTKFLYDGINILEDYAAGGAVLAYYVQGIGIDKLIKRVTDAGSEYYHSDALGSVRALTDKDGNQVGTYAYDAWGKITGSTGQSSNEYKFTSRRWEEEIGLQYNRARFYDPETGRFTTPDPLTGGPDDPTISYFSGIYSIFHRFIKEHVDALQPDKHNRYVYCYNNPVNLIDPLGLEAGEVISDNTEAAAAEEKEGEILVEFRNSNTSSREQEIIIEKMNAVWEEISKEVSSGKIDRLSLDRHDMRAVYTTVEEYEEETGEELKDRRGEITMGKYKRSTETAYVFSDRVEKDLEAQGIPREDTDTRTNFIANLLNSEIAKGFAHGETTHGGYLTSREINPKYYNDIMELTDYDIDKIVKNHGERDWGRPSYIVGIKELDEYPTFTELIESLEEERKSK